MWDLAGISILIFQPVSNIHLSGPPWNMTVVLSESPAISFPGELWTFVVKVD
jgi:hypothetical protein